VEAYAANQTLFFEDFASAFKKVIERGVPFKPTDVEFQV
jgi:catalase (peroxidase I)